MDEYGFERGEDFNYEAYEQFMSEYLPVLARRSRRWARLMGNPNSLKQGPTVKRYIRKGVPAEHRAEVSVSRFYQTFDRSRKLLASDCENYFKVWLWASGAYRLKEKMGPNLYRELLDSVDNDDEVISSIRTDLPRTFPDNIFFNKSDHCEQRNQLFRVLCAYAHHNKHVGYCQVSAHLKYY